MDFEAKTAYRKSRAPWQSGNQENKAVNPYANANANTSMSSDTAPQSNPYANIGASNRKHTRRLSIHASAAAHAHGRSFTQQAPFDLSSMPPVPQLDKPVANNFDVAEPEHYQEDLDIETKILQELSHGSATEIDDYYKVLTKQKSIITRDINANINLNQKNILELTNDLNETKSELMQLRISTKELYGILDEFKIAAERRMELEFESKQDQPQEMKKISNRNKRDRSSIILLQKMWASEIQSLFKHVEGASKFIQAGPDKHVLAESGRWFEINVGIWKPSKAAHLFILNDSVLIASKKRSQEGGQSRLHAVHCWPLLDVYLTEVHAPTTNNSEAKTYFINLKSKQLSYVFQTDRYDHFLKVTDAFNKGKSELLAKVRQNDTPKQSQESAFIGEEKRTLRDSLRNSGNYEGVAEDFRRSGSQRQSSEGMLQDISARVHSRNRSHDLNSSMKLSQMSKGQFFYDLRRLEDKIDEVDVEIAHNKYTESIGLIRYIENKLSSIESAVSSNSSSGGLSASEELKLLMDVIKLKIKNRKVSIQNSLAFEMKENAERLTHNDIYQIIELFYSFNQLNKGISLYLQAMSHYLSSTVSKLVVSIQGSTKIDIVNYLSNLVIINVSILKRTIAVYQECIVPILRKDQEGGVDSSGLINWCVEECKGLVESIKKHLHGTLIMVSKSDSETEVPIYKVKDPESLNSFLDTITPQLDDLKAVGVNVDYLFESIYVIRDSSD